MVFNEYSGKCKRKYVVIMKIKGEVRLVDINLVLYLF